MVRVRGYKRKGRHVSGYTRGRARANWHGEVNYLNPVRGRRDRKKDGKIKALPAGKRRTRHGTTYWEGRVNRADLQRKKKPYL